MARGLAVALLAAGAVLALLGGCSTHRLVEKMRADDAPRMVDLFRGTAGAREAARDGVPGMGGSDGATGAGPESRPSTAPRRACGCPWWAMRACGRDCAARERARRQAERVEEAVGLAAQALQRCRWWLFSWRCELRALAAGVAGATEPPAPGSVAKAPGQGSRGGSGCEMTAADAGGGEPRPAGRYTAADMTRSAANELELLFPRIPNPDVLIYVFPHLATSAMVPVPGYTTAVPLYEGVRYALPGEEVVR